MCLFLLSSVVVVDDLIVDEVLMDDIVYVVANVLVVEA